MIENKGAFSGLPQERKAETISNYCQESVDLLDEISNNPDLLGVELKAIKNSWELCFATKLNLVIAHFNFLKENISQDGEGDQVLRAEYQKELSNLEEKNNNSQKGIEVLDENDKPQMIKDLKDLAKNIADQFRYSIPLL